MRRGRAVALAALVGAVAYVAGCATAERSIPTLSVDAPPGFDPEALYELCPDCGGEGAWCLRCFDYGLILHDCRPEA